MEVHCPKDSARLHRSTCRLIERLEVLLLRANKRRRTLVHLDEVRRSKFILENNLIEFV